MRHQTETKHLHPKIRPCLNGKKNRPSSHVSRIKGIILIFNHFLRILIIKFSVSLNFLSRVPWQRMIWIQTFQPWLEKKKVRKTRWKTRRCMLQNLSGRKIKRYFDSNRFLSSQKFSIYENEFSIIFINTHLLCFG